MTEHWAIVPVKGLTESKSRLSGYLQDKKKAFVEALLDDVLRSIVKSKLYGTVLVISPDENVGDQAQLNDVSFLKQTSIGLNRAIEQANKLALKDHALSSTTILADIPLVQPADLRELFNLGSNTPRVIMAPSLRGGTNVLLTSPPGSIRPSYGRWSYSKHLRQAQIHSMDAYSMSNARLSLDIDTIDDLIELSRRDPERCTGSAKIMSDVGRLMTVPTIIDRN